jgi:hypothetical protein
VSAVPTIRPIPSAAKGGAEPRDVERQLVGITDYLRLAADEDVRVDGGPRLLLRSPDGHYWSITVDNAGALVTTDVGTDP